MDLRTTFEQIKIDLDAFFAAYRAGDFSSEEEEARGNLAIRSRMKQLILRAYELNHPEIMNETLEILSMSTGCMEDYEIFTDITDDLLRKNIITVDKIKELLHSAPVNRWL